MRKKVHRVGMVVLALVVLAGCSAKTSDKPAVQNPIEQLIIWADADPEDGDAPLSVALTCEPLEEIDGAEYVWDPGDGTGAIAGQNVTHVYERPGVYKARCTVTDAHDNRGEDEARIDVEMLGE